MRKQIDNAARVLTARFGVVREIEPYQTWGRTVVAAGLVGDDRRPVVLKATAERDVLADALDACFARNASALDRRPSRLLHGDLGDTEVFVDENLDVTGVVD